MKGEQEEERKGSGERMHERIKGLDKILDQVNRRINRAKRGAQ